MRSARRSKTPAARSSAGTFASTPRSATTRSIGRRQQGKCRLDVVTRRPCPDESSTRRRPSRDGIRLTDAEGALGLFLRIHLVDGGGDGEDCQAGEQPEGVGRDGLDEGGAMGLPQPRARSANQAAPAIPVIAAPAMHSAGAIVSAIRTQGSCSATGVSSRTLTAQAGRRVPSYPGSDHLGGSANQKENSAP
jgi:hypothetical protein